MGKHKTFAGGSIRLFRDIACAMGRAATFRVAVWAASLALVFLTAHNAQAEETQSQWGLRGALGASLDRTGTFVSSGAVWRLNSRLRLGATAEWNPWMDVASASASPGAFNLYASGHLVWLSGERFEVRSTGHSGTSVLLFNAVGARAGSVGVFLGLSIFNVSLKLNPRWTLDIVPEVALPIPSLGGVPFVYMQYRMMLGLTRW